jgi:16S rRNA (guanine966-N2)-methyltransferase
VVAGTARGRRLVSPSGTDTRPTSDRVREAVFNALTSLDVVHDADVVDLFAGSGALGIEALSRGARRATFVDRDQRAIAAIRSNLDTLGFAAVADVRAASVESVLDAAVTQGRYWDVALCDPPYAFDDWTTLAAEVPATWLVAESNRDVELGEGWEVVRQKRYGSTVVFVARRDGPGGADALGPPGEMP